MITLSPKPLRLYLMFVSVVSLTTLTDIHAANVVTTLAWNGDPAATTATTYRVYYGTAPDALSSVIQVGNATTCQTPALPNDRDYYFAATAVDANGIESALSETVTRKATIPAPSEVKLAWEPGLVGEAVRYRVYYGIAPDQMTSTLEAGTATTVSTPALPSDVTYYFAVASYNDSGIESAWSDIVVRAAYEPESAPPSTVVAVASPTPTAATISAAYPPATETVGGGNATIAGTGVRGGLRVASISAGAGAGNRLRAAGSSVVTTKAKVQFAGTLNAVDTRVWHRTNRSALKPAKGTSRWTFKTRVRLGRNRVDILERDSRNFTRERQSFIVLRVKSRD